MNQDRFEHVVRSKAFMLLLLIPAVSLFVSGCQEAKVYRVGVLAGLNFIADVEEGFKEGMTELGYIEGENIIYDVRTTDFDIPTYQNVIQEFIADEVDLIFVYPTEATLEAKNLTAGTDIPVIFNFALIEGLGVVDTIQEPGGNLTGVRYPGVDVAILRYEMLRDMLPGMERLIVPYQNGYPIVQPQLEALKPIAAADGVTLVEVPANNAADVAAYLQGLDDADDYDAIFLLVEPLATTPEAFAVLADFAQPRQIPVGGVYLTADDYAAVFGVNVDIYGSGRLAAPLADKIFQGTDPGTLPVVSAEPYIEIDYRMAQELGIDIPDNMLVIANEVYR